MALRIHRAYDELSTKMYDVEMDSRLVTLLYEPWLQKKLDRTRRLTEHREYILNYCPELETMKPGVVLDLGPGDGMFLEFARELEHDVFGIDAANGNGGMGDNYLEACEIITGQKCLFVEYAGVLRVVDRWRYGESQVTESKYANLLHDGGGIAIINARGSLEQIFSVHMEGLPHDQHHLAERMAWRLGDVLTRKAIRDFMRWIAHQLRPGGFFLCHMNGSQNTEEAEICLDQMARAAGLAYAFRTTSRLRVWEKPISPADAMGDLNLTVCPG